MIVEEILDEFDVPNEDNEVSGPNASVNWRLTDGVRDPTTLVGPKVPIKSADPKVELAISPIDISGNKLPSDVGIDGGDLISKGAYSGGKSASFGLAFRPAKSCWNAGLCEYGKLVCGGDRRGKRGDNSLKAPPNPVIPLMPPRLPSPEK